ncbi:hypothetical protein KR222_000541 [Zaprionus bogoriensis]|nr:hypothetical protein KR222_000541 [Zaprionus bogoriensis]
MNNKENNSGTNLNQVFEDDNCSNYSEVSHVSARSDAATTGQEEQPIRVRDMINLYNFATQKNQELAQAKSIYFGNNLKDMELTQQQQQLDQESCGSVCLKLPQMNAQASSSKKPGTFRLTTSDDQTSLQQSPQADCADGDAGTSEAIEKSYQSKTTIRRTEQGVRIIIDIFFDKQDNEIDIIGSRVETDIPESRILADFQQHAMGMRSQKINDAPHV